MALDRFLYALLRFWFLVVLFAGVGVLGVWAYFHWNGQSEAVATVAVLEPVASLGSNGQQAHVTFAALAESELVAERVVNKLGLDLAPKDLKGKVSVDLSRSLVPSEASPIYVVSVTDRDANRAIQLVNAVVDEARLVFVEMNSLDRGELDAAFAADEDRLRKEYQAAQDALLKFEEQHGARRLHTRIDAQLSLVNSLRQADRLSQGGGATSAARDAIAQELAAAEAKLAELRRLQPEYERLALDVALATNTVTQLTGRRAEVAIANDPAGLEGHLVEGKADLDRARAALAAFQQSNGIADLPTEIAAQTARVIELRRFGQGNGAQESQIAAARLSVDQAKNASFAANAERDGICGNPTSPKFACDAANARALSAETAVRQAELAVSALEGGPNSPEATQALAAAEAELERLRQLQPEYERLALDVALATNTVTQLTSRRTDLAVGGDPSAVQAELAAARASLDQARAALVAFQQANQIADLPAELAVQTALVNDLRRQDLAIRVSGADVGAALAEENAELERLLALLPEYEQLVARVTQTGAWVNQIETRKLELLVGDNLSPSSQIKLIDPGRVEPNTFWTIALYLLGTVLGLSVGFVFIYLIAYFDRTPRTIEDVQELTGLPVLARMPRAF